MKRIREVDIIRSLAILLVVFTHCFAVYTGSWTNPNPELVKHIFGYKVFTDLLSAFRMPAVVLIAGYVFTYFQQARPQSFSSIVKSKFKRLIIPSYVFGVIYIISFRDFNLKSFIIDLTSGVGHLWFLPMLFWCFLFGYFLVRISNIKIQIFTLVMLFLVSLVSPLLPNILGISRALFFVPFYYLGCILWKNRSYFKDKIINRKNLIFIISVFIILFVTISFYKYCYFNNNLIGKMILLTSEIVLKTIGVLAFYLITMFFVKTKIGKFLIG